ncbi:MAG: ethanolamine ammonia-lyase subunit EutB, partial [Gammaproteobacteria bacterium]
MHYTASLRGKAYRFPDLRTLLARASPLRSADELAGLVAGSEEERAVAQQVLADVPLRQFLEEPLIDTEIDEVSRLILQSHSQDAFAPLASQSVGEFREWLLSEGVTPEVLAAARSGITPEMAAGVSKIMRNQDLIAVARRCHNVARFRNTIGLPGHLSTRLQPNHPTDDARGI